MNLPLAAVSSATSQAPPGTARPGAGVHAPRPASAGRSHAGHRPEPTTLPAAKRPAAFARVLEAVQEQEPSIADREDGHTASGVDRVAQPERDTSERSGEPGRVEPLIVEEPRAPTPTPWLLLSLSSGPHAWNRGSQPSPEASDDPGCHQEALVDSAALGAMPAMAAALIVDVTLRQVNAGVESLPGVPPVDASIGLLSGGGPRTPQEAGGAASLAVAVAAAATSREPAPAEPGPADRAADPSHGSIDTSLAASASDAARSDETRGEAPPALAPPDEALASSSAALDTRARWLTATRRAGADVERPHGTADPPVAPGLAARQVAHVLGRDQHAGVTEPGSGAGPIGPEQVSPAMMGTVSTPRPGEALLRLAQPEGAVSRADRDSRSSAAAVSILSPALTLPAVSEPVTTAPVPPAVLPAAAGDQVMHQLVQSLRMQWKDGVGEAKVHLRPDALGSVSVTLRVEAGAVTAVVRAESPQVQEWVLQHQQTLRQQLESAGLRLDELVVSPDDQRQPEQPPDAPPDQRRRPRGPRSGATTDGARFEQLL